MKQPLKSCLYFWKAERITLWAWILSAISILYFHKTLHINGYEHCDIISPHLDTWRRELILKNSVKGKKNTKHWRMQFKGFKLVFRGFYCSGLVYFNVVNWYYQSNINTLKNWLGQIRLLKPVISSRVVSVQFTGR